MTKDHIIIGFGRWGKIIFENIQNKNFFKRIYIKSRNQQFVYDTINKTLTIVAKNILKRKFFSGHICTPVKKHFYYANKLKAKKFIIEKPTFSKDSEYDILQKKKINFITNYSDLLSPNFDRLINLLRNKKNYKIVLNYRNKTLKYKKNYECLNDWLDHPLSIILSLSNNLKKFEIKNFKREKVKNFICESAKIKFFTDNSKITLNLNTNSQKKKLRNITFNEKHLSYVYNFYKCSFEKKIKDKKNIISSKKNSIINIYEKYFFKNDFKNKISINFSKNIYQLKKQIIEEIKTLEN